MGAVVGIDLSSRAIDLVKLDEDSNRAEWVRCDLEGKDAWERTLMIRSAMPQSAWWEDVYMVSIEAPFGSGQPGTQATLNRVVGAILSSLPHRLLVPERCWIVRPDEWKGGLGLKGKPTESDLPDDRMICATKRDSGWDEAPSEEAWQNARDAYCLAFWMRQINEAAVESFYEEHGL